MEVPVKKYKAVYPNGDVVLVQKKYKVQYVLVDDKDKEVVLKNFDKEWEIQPYL